MSTVLNIWFGFFLKQFPVETEGRITGKYTENTCMSQIIKHAKITVI